MATTLLRLLRRRYPHIAREVLAPLVEVLDEAERTFAGDLEKFHILLAVALRTAEHPGLSAIDLDALRRGELQELPSLWTNVHSISLSIGVPEETVRRKVRDLVREGWLERADHSVRYTPRAAREFAPLRELVLRLAAANYRTVSGVLETADTTG